MSVGAAGEEARAMRGGFDLVRATLPPRIPDHRLHPHERVETTARNTGGVGAVVLPREAGKGKPRAVGIGSEYPSEVSLSNSALPMIVT